MAETAQKSEAAPRSPNRRFAVDLLRAAGGALFFSFPMLMTMEMWQLGFYMNRGRLALFMLAVVPVLIGLSYFGGFEKTETIRDDAVDAFVAYAVGFVAATIILLLFGVIGAEMSVSEIVGKISLQAIVGALGAVFTQSLFGGADKEAERKRRRLRYGGQLFLMLVGAIFTSMSLAATEEIILIAFQMSEWHALLLSFLTLAVIHAFILAGEFRNRRRAIAPDAPFVSVFLRFTVVGYAIALCVSAYILWTFGRVDALALEDIVKAAIVLGFPAALGASAARLIL